MFFFSQMYEKVEGGGGKGVYLGFRVGLMN
jgi:hypothetical protein